jgi:hypothetical protein
MSDYKARKDAMLRMAKRIERQSGGRMSSAEARRVAERSAERKLNTDTKR